MKKRLKIKKTKKSETKYHGLFSIGTSDEIISELLSALPKIDDDSKTFTGSANVLLMTVVPCLVELRDKYNCEFSQLVLGYHLTLDGYVELSDDSRLSKNNRNTLKTFLNLLPGYIEGCRAERQPCEVGIRLSFTASYFTFILQANTTKEYVKK
ncbi:MAG: hypothetical protein QM500_16775, partial [Methylococcales bacterium]